MQYFNSPNLPSISLKIKVDGLRWFKHITEEENKGFITVT